MGAEQKAKLATELTLTGADKFAQLAATAGRVGAGIKSAFGDANSSFYFMRSNISALNGFMERMRDKLIGPAVLFDDMREKLQFVGLSATDAKAKIEEMYQWSGKLDQPHAATVNALKEAMKYGIGDSFDEMQAMSDAAKFADSDFASMVSTFGTLKQKLASGKEFDSAARGLLSMGLISGETMQKIQALNDAISGKSAQDADDALEKRIELLKEQMDFLGGGPDYNALVNEYNDLVRERMRRKTAPPEERPDISGLWPEIMKEIRETTKSVAAADPTFNDKLQRVDDSKTRLKARMLSPHLDDMTAEKAGEIAKREEQYAMMMNNWRLNMALGGALRTSAGWMDMANDPVFAAMGRIQENAAVLMDPSKRTMQRVAGDSIIQAMFPIYGGLTTLASYMLNSSQSASMINTNLAETVRLSAELNGRMTNLIDTVAEGQGKLK